MFKRLTDPLQRWIFLIQFTIGVTTGLVSYGAVKQGNSDSLASLQLKTENIEQRQTKAIEEREMERERLIKIETDVQWLCKQAGKPGT